MLAIGIALGCTYDGQDDGLYYFNVLGHTFFIGAVLWGGCWGGYAVGGKTEITDFMGVMKNNAIF